jgi:isochorismate pyruvate lyase
MTVSKPESAGSLTAEEYKMKKAEACNSLQEIRDAIDEIDGEIIGLIGQRAGFVRSAARFKASAASVKAEDRVTAMIATRRLWAEAQGLAPDFIERLFRLIVEYFTGEEMAKWQAERY